MLSTENPPPDLQCPCEISQQKGSSCNDERACDDNQLEVDLFKSGLDDSSSLPKFSIRDYVFNTRSKDVENNWPFSLKNLQLCLKYGVKDVLPPFQPLDSVRNPLITKYAVEEYEVSDHSIGPKLAEDTKNIDSSGSEADKVFPLTTTSQSCSDYNLVKDPNLEPEAEYLPGSSSKKVEFGVQASNKGKSNTQNPVKKCKLIVKLKNIAEPKVAEDLSVNNCVASDSMATKVCPVCKTFSFSSNTTLNAHIDQCLSGESSVKWATDSKAIKHRIKPRKTRLMVDIYETALECALEDLDKRNGTNWASNLGLPDDQDLQTYAEEKNKINASVNLEENDREGSVYIDSNGTKVRILSKLSDLPSNAYANASGRIKPGKRDKGNKLLSSKKKLIGQKHKAIKSPPRVHRGSPRYHLEVDGHPKKIASPEGYKDDCMQPLVASDWVRSDGLGMIKHWVGSKRSGLKKKNNLEHENQCPHKIIKNSVKSGALSLEERDTSSMSPVSYDENPCLPTESNKRKANLLCDDSDDGCLEPSCQEKTQGYSCQEGADGRNHCFLTKPKVKQSRIDNSSFHESIVDLPNSTENHVFPRRNKMVVNISPAVNVDSPFMSSKSINYTVSSGSRKFPSPKKKLLSVRDTLVPELRKKSGRKHLDFKKPKRRCPSGSEEVMIQSRPESCRQENLVGNLAEKAAQSKKTSAKPFINGARVSKIQKKRAKFISTSEGDMTLNSSEISPESDSHGPDKNNDSFDDGNVPVGVSNVLEKDKLHDEFAYEPTYKIADGETFAAFSKSLETAFPGLDYPSDVAYASQHYNEAYKGNCQAEPALGDKQEGFCSDKTGNNLITSSGGHVMVEMDGNEAQGNYFVDVDPIPIPGPPGSFLPSPGRMSSEELQGNSSLTACMMQSSENEHEAVDMDSLDSPISATSVVSDSVAARSNSVSVNLPEQSTDKEIQCDVSESGFEPGVDHSTCIAQVTTADRKSDLHESRTNPTLPEIAADRFKSIPPCCCSRKDVALLGDSFINQESQFVRQQPMASWPVLAEEKKLPDDPKEKAHLFNLRSEALPAQELTPEPGKFVPNSPVRCAPVLVSHHLEAKFPVHGDCESSSPSTSNPVLRLMGKNLMVMNKDENLSPSSWPTQSSMVISHPGLRMHVDNSLSTGKYQDELYTFHPFVSQGPSVLVNMQASMPAPSFDYIPYDGFKAPAPVRPLRSSAHPSGAVFPNKNFGGNLIAPLKCREYAGLNQLDTSAAYDIENVPSPVPTLRATDSSGTKHKGIIVIDESREYEANIAIKVTPPEMNRSMKFGEYSAGISAPMVVSQCDSRRVNPYYSYQTRGYPLHAEPPAIQNGNNTQVPSALYFSRGFS